MKTQTCINMDTDVMAELKLRRENVSSLINSYLRAFLSMERKTNANKTELKKVILETETKLLEQKQRMAILLQEEDNQEKEQQSIDAKAMAEKVAYLQSKETPCGQ